MNLILTMAGRYTRFTNEGYKIPKYLLPWGDHTILSEILNQLITNPITPDNTYLVVNEADNQYFPHIRKIMSVRGIPTHNMIIIGETYGQAQTASIGIKTIQDTIKKLDGHIVFHNIDTILYKRDFLDIEAKLYSNDGYIDLFESNNHQYSYVLVEEGMAKEISEKILISNLATSGLYAFKTADIFLKYYEFDSYISEVYRRMISEGKRVAVGSVYTESETLVLGTPFEYLNLSKNIK